MGGVYILEKEEKLALDILALCDQLSPTQFKELIDLLNEFYMMRLENKDNVVQ